MINNVQSTNFNPTFNARVHVTDEALKFFMDPKHISKEKYKGQLAGLKIVEDNNTSIEFDYDKLTNSIATKIIKLTGDKVFSGRTIIALNELNNTFDLVKNAKDVIDNYLKEDPTLSPEMFDFMA